MPRVSQKSDELSAITARRESLLAELAAVDEKLKAAELASLDAGRPVLLAALERVKIAKMDKADAKSIATAINRHGGKAIADHLVSLASS